MVYDPENACFYSSVEVDFTLMEGTQAKNV